MELYKNINSEKLFIHLETTNDNEALFITPENEIKQLRLEFFEYWMDEDISSLLSQNLVTESQLLKYDKHKAGQSDRRIEDVVSLYNNLSLKLQIKFDKEERIPELKEIWASFERLSKYEITMFYLRFLSEEQLSEVSNKATELLNNRGLNNP